MAVHHDGRDDVHPVAVGDVRLEPADVRLEAVDDDRLEAGQLAVLVDVVEPGAKNEKKILIKQLLFNDNIILSNLLLRDYVAILIDILHRDLLMRLVLLGVDVRWSVVLLIVRLRWRLILLLLVRWRMLLKEKQVKVSFCVMKLHVS